MDDFSSPNMLNSFNLKPSDSNLIEPGKRPMSSMSPIIIVDTQSNNDVRLVLGKILTYKIFRLQKAFASFCYKRTNFFGLPI